MAAGGYETEEFAVLVQGLPELVIPCEDGRDALSCARMIGPVARPVVRMVSVTDWTVIDEEWAT